MDNEFTGVTVKDAELSNFKLLKHVQSNKCLDGNGSNVYISNCDNNNTYQKWSGKDNLLKHEQSGKCLDGNGSDLYFNICDTNNTYQIFNPETGSSGSLYK
jgi:hypothetical protein